MVHQGLNEQLAEAGIQPIGSRLFPLCGDDAGMVFAAMCRLADSDYPQMVYQKMCGAELPDWDGSYDGLCAAIENMHHHGNSHGDKIELDTYYNWLYEAFVAPVLLIDKARSLEAKYGPRIAQIRAENEALRQAADRKDDSDGTAG